MPLEKKLAVIREIVYLKTTGEKSQRVVKRESVGRMKHRGKYFPGMVAYCCKRNEIRTFRVDRILDLKRLSTAKGP